MYIPRIEMADSPPHEFGATSEKCESTFSDTVMNIPEIRTFSSTSEIIKKSTGRHSFSKRRSSCFDISANAGSTNDQKMEITTGGVQECGAGSTSVEQCTEGLKHEKEAWRALYEERKQKFKELKVHSSCKPLKLDWGTCVDVLSDEDKRFLDAQPDYESTVLKMNRAAEMAAICMHTKHASAHASNSVIQMAEQQGAAVKKRILKYAESYFT